MKKLLLIVLMGFLLVSLASAFNLDYYLSSPSEILENEWVIFSGIFIVIFAIVYFALQKQMKDNLGAAIVISLVLGLFIAASVAQRARFYGYFGETIGSWSLLIGFIIAGAFLIKLVFSKFGITGTMILLIFIWLVMQARDPYELFPYDLTESVFFSIWLFLRSYWMLAILIIFTIALMASPNFREKFKEKQKTR